jgi:hypothetical protein
MLVALFINSEQIGDMTDMTESEITEYRKEMFNNLKRIGWELKEVTEDQKKIYIKESLKTHKTTRTKLSRYKKNEIIKSKFSHSEIARQYGISKSYVTQLKLRARLTNSI